MSFNTLRRECKFSLDKTIFKNNLFKKKLLILILIFHILLSLSLISSKEPENINLEIHQKEILSIGDVNYLKISELNPNNTELDKLEFLEIENLNNEIKFNTKANKTNNGLYSKKTSSGIDNLFQKLNFTYFEKLTEKLFDNTDHCMNVPNYPINSLKNLNKEQKFILGKCNPILYIAGFLGVRLTASVNCKNIVYDPKKLHELRYFCGKNICKQAFLYNYDIEEYTLWPALFNNPFKLLQDDGNSDNSCFAYFMRHFNDENQCGKDEETGVSICLHHKDIKVSYFGDTDQTQDKSECGTRAISRIVDGGYYVIPDYLINSPAANGNLIFEYFEQKIFYKLKIMFFNNFFVNFF